VTEVAVSAPESREEAGIAAPPDAAREVARACMAAGAPHVRSVLHFGSTRSGATPGARSVHDLFVVVDDYGGFYRRAGRALAPRRSPRWLARLNAVLPPNVLHGRTAAGDAKLFVISERDLARAVGPRPRDHFVRARLAQDVAVCAAADAAAAARAGDALTDARRRVVEWARPFVPAPFDAAGLARAALEVSYSAEIRPESAARVHEVFDAQRDFLVRTTARALEEAERAGRVERRAAGWAWTRPPGRLERARARAWLAKSRLRATLRWAKYLVTFEGWLEYVVAKVERRTGARIALTERERRWPLLLLWPKFFRVMRARRGGTSGGEGR